LYDTDYSLGKICEMAGFSSNKAMFQAFKTALGMSPSQFRNLHRKKK
ncbi:MAG: helix-turn-helix domain-containing protein, partial [Lachnospiraceae bacterium]|nr:helix-turn-helix domain-containing protein [Lachnospiraceae bacterium]